MAIEVDINQLQADICKLKELGKYVGCAENQLRVNINNARDITKWGVITDFFKMNELLCDSIVLFTKTCRDFQEQGEIVLKKIETIGDFDTFEWIDIHREYQLFIEHAEVTINSVEGALNNYDNGRRFGPYISNCVERVDNVLEYLFKDLTKYKDKLSKENNYENKTD